MIVGKLDRRIEIQEPVTTQDTFGAESVAWQTFARVWAQATPMQAKERHQSAQIRESKVYSFVIRHLVGVESTFRIVFESEIYRILGVAEIGRRIGLEITAEYFEKHGTST